tara:strand:- start:1662 stop:1964 length:303 start_codon:yes stop_codon:yes gene_type:complete
MEDGRKNNGGHKNSGRKSKAEEFRLIENLDKQRDPTSLIEKMFEHIDAGSEKMLEKYLAYRFGMPKQVTDVTTNGKDVVHTIVISDDVAKKLSDNIEDEC